MAKFLLVGVAAVAVSSWTGGGELFTAAQGDNPILFELPMPDLLTKVKPSCVFQSDVGADICEEDPEYDARIEQHVKTLLGRDRSVNALFNDPSLRGILNDILDPVTVGIRFGTVAETPVCSAQETLIFPKRAKTTTDDWVFVLNQEGMQQALRVEKCTSDGSTCGLGMVLPGDTKATCRQKYVYRRMLVVGSNKIQPEEVLMPSCCVCYTTYAGLVTSSRSGIGNSTRSHKPSPAAQPEAPPAAPAAPPMRGPSGPSASPISGSFQPMRLKFSRSLRRPLTGFFGHQHYP